MSEAEHLTDKEIAGYYDGAFAGTEQDEIGRHLLFCAACREKLPAPSVEGFLRALFEEDELVAAGGQPLTPVVAVKRSPPFLSAVSEFFGYSSNLAWSGAAALILLLSFSFVMWFAATRQSNAGGDEIAQTFETNEPQLKGNQPPKATILPTDQTAANDKSLPELKSGVSATKPVAAKPIVPKDSLSSPAPNTSVKISRSVIPNAKKETISATRGGASSVAPCSEELTLTTTGEAENGTITLKWKKVAKAAKYHLYVSDDDEILLDEFESTSETIYVLRKPLDPQKTYRWKVVVTLEDGKTIVGSSQKFTAKDLKFNQMKINKKRNFDVRCSGEK